MPAGTTAEELSENSASVVRKCYELAYWALAFVKGSAINHLITSVNISSDALLPKCNLVELIAKFMQVHIHSNHEIIISPSISSDS